MWEPDTSTHSGQSNRSHTNLIQSDGVKEQKAFNDEQEKVVTAEYSVS